MSEERLKEWLLSVLLGGLVCFGAVTDSIAGVNINIGTPDLNIRIGPPPPVVIQAPPPMAVIPGTYVYIAPNVGVDILFYHGHWYRPHEGRWFSSPSYNGPWTYVAPAGVPRPILELPPGYRRLPPGRRIPFDHVKGSWEKWEREKHWHQDKDWRGGWKGGYEEVGRRPEGHHEGHR